MKLYPHKASVSVSEKETASVCRHLEVQFESKTICSNGCSTQSPETTDHKDFKAVTDGPED